MHSLRRANQQTAARQNRHLVLNLLQQRGPMSRRQLAQTTRLQGSTLTYIVRDLLDQHVLRPAGKHDGGTVGPKHELIEINGAMGHVVGVDVRRKGANIVVRDLAGGLVDIIELPMPGRLNELHHVIGRALDQHMADRRERIGPLLGIGVGVAGVTNADTGVVLNSTSFDVRDLPLRDILAERFADAAILIDHNTNFAAHAEHREGAARGLDDFILLLFDPDRDSTAAPTYRSFGAALYLSGRIYRGAHYAAGEIDVNIAPRPQFVAELAEIDLLCQPDAPLTDNLRQFADMLARTICSMINLVDPRAVILSSSQIIANHAFLDAIREQLPKRVVAVATRNVPVIASTLATRAVARGAALAVADTVLGRCAEKSAAPVAASFA
jgi:predicted NBD/HSP70 family sugar kinase